MWRLSIAIALLAAVCASSPTPAQGAWPVSYPDGVLLGYGESYPRAGDQAVHRGVDIAAPTGAVVRAPEEGTVSFAGLVPGENGQVLAVSIRTPQGLTVSVLPLEGAAVSAGDYVAGGDVLGALAQTGDVSSSVPHVHVSLRREQTYLDPMLVLGPAEALSPDTGSGVNAPTSAEVPHEPANSTIPAPVSSSVGQVAAAVSVPQVGGRAASVPAQESIGSPVQASAAASDVQRAPTTAGGVTQGQIVLAGAPAGAASVAAPVASTRARVPGHGSRVLGRIVHTPGVQRSLLVTVGGCLAAVAGLWPLWRPATGASLSYGVRPILDNVAAAVGR